jgi:hypothetical protein
MAANRYDVTSTQAQGGANSLSVTIQSGFAQFAQWRTVPVATAYRLSVWVRAEQPRRTAENTELAAAAAAVNASAGSEAEAAAAAAGMPITLSLRLQGEPYKTFGAVSSLVSSQWVQLVVPAVVIPEGAGDGDSIEVLFLINTGKPRALPSSCCWYLELSCHIIQPLCWPQCKRLHIASAIHRQQRCLLSFHMCCAQC